MTSYGEARLTAAPRANFVEDVTQVAGLTVIFGLFALVPNIINLSSEAEDQSNSVWEGDGENGTFPPIARLLGFMTVSLFGLVSIFVGFQYLVCKWGSKLTSLLGLGITLAAWFPFLVIVSFVLYQADFQNVGGGGPLQISPDSYNPTSNQIWAIAIMGVFGFYGYAGTVIGALTFLHWKMYRCFAGYSHTYTASYYRSRLSYYGFLAIMTGLVQLSLGAYIIENFGEGQLPVPIVAGPSFYVSFPELNVIVGICQFLLGLYICSRSTTSGVGPSTGNKDPGLFSFQVAAWSVYIISVGCQILGQTSLADEANAGFILNVTGFCLFPIYLDVMAHTTPESITSDMFSANKGLGSGV